MVQNLAVSAPPPPACHADPAAEAAYLRTLIEKQPSPLMRVAMDGSLLAVSDAALNLLAGRDLAQVLGTNLSDRLAPEQASQWRDFADRVGKNGSASVECTLTDLSETARVVQLQGVALTDHPDGIDSILVTARDVSAARRLEASLTEQESQRQLIKELRTKQTETIAAQQRLESMIAEREAQLQRLMQDQAADREAQQASLAEAHRVHLLQQERQMHQTIDALHTELEQESQQRQALQALLEQTVAEREAFEAALREREAKRQKLVADHATARIRAEQSLADAQAQIEKLTQALSTIMDAAAIARQAVKVDPQM
jgi:hypothetical protein